MVHSISANSGASAVIEIVLQILDALAYLHVQTPPLIHRTLNQSTLLVTAQDRATLIDFGIAYLFKPQTAAPTVAEQNYTSPESLRAKVQPVSDLYWLGATMQNLHSGYDFGGAASYDPPPLERLKPNLSRELSQHIDQAAASSVEARFASAEEFIQKLHLAKRRYREDGASARRLTNGRSA